MTKQQQPQILFLKNNQKKKNTERRYTSKQKIFKIHFKDSLAARFTVRMSVLASTSAKLKLGAELGGEGEGCFAGMRGGWHEWLHRQTFPLLVS